MGDDTTGDDIAEVVELRPTRRGRPDRSRADRFAGDFDEGIIVTPEHQVDPEPEHPRLRLLPPL